jgi:hypothetical protein
VAGDSGSGSGGPHQECWFCQTTSAKLYNVGNDRSPKMVCPGCNGARKALDVQAKTGGKAMLETLKNLKSKELTQYKALVVASVIPGAEARGMGNALQKQERGRAVGTFFMHAAETSVALRHEEPIWWMDYHEYVAHHMNTKGHSAEEAVSKWKQDKGNSDIGRRGGGKHGDNDLRLAVAGVPSTTRVTERAAKRTVHAAFAVNSEAKMGQASKRMSLGSLPGMDSQGFVEAGGDVFSIGGASSTSLRGAASSRPVYSIDEQPIRQSEFTNAALELADTVPDEADAAEQDEEEDVTRRTRLYILYCKHLFQTCCTCCMVDLSQTCCTCCMV